MGAKSRNCRCQSPGPVGLIRCPSVAIGTFVGQNMQFLLRCVALVVMERDRTSAEISTTMFLFVVLSGSAGRLASSLRGGADPFVLTVVVVVSSSSDRCG